MTSPRYKPLSTTIRPIEEDGSSSNDPEPSITPAQEGVQDEPSSNPDQQPACASNKATADPKHTTKETFRSKLSHLWYWISHLLDDEPYKVKEGFGNISWNLFKRLLTAGILASALGFGAVGMSFDVADRKLWKSYVVNQDAQLAAFGILNTVLAYMVRDSLKHISDFFITKWMIAGDGGGATVLDFEMSEELTKPWAALLKFHTRRKQHGWSAFNILRLILSITTGTCLLLQGAGMNTVGMPKRRWWPDAESFKPTDDRFHFTNKTMRVANVSEMSVWGRSWNMIREGGDVSWELAHTFAALSTLEALEGLHNTVDQPAGWRGVGDNARLVSSVLNVTNTSTRSIQAASINGNSTVQMWDEQRELGNSWARRAVGWYAALKLTGILLDTRCTEVAGHDLGSWNASSTHNATIVLDIGPFTHSDTEFQGATCTITVQQALIEIFQWIVDEELDRDKPGWTIDDTGSKPYPKIDLLPATSADVRIAEKLSDWFNAVSPSLQNLSSNKNALNLTSIAVRLAGGVVDLGHGHDTMDGLAMVVSRMFSSFLATFEWTFEEIDGMMTRQGPIRWEIYGSGPRLKWQWAIAAVLGVNALIQVFDMFLSVVYRQAKGLWLSLGGMLVAANAADRMKSVGNEQGAGFVAEDGKHVTYFVRQTAESGQDVKATLVSQDEVADARYATLETNRSY